MDDQTHESARVEDEPMTADSLGTRDVSAEATGTSLDFWEELDGEHDELPDAPPELERRAIRLRPVVGSVRAAPLVASGSATLRGLASSAGERVRSRAASARAAREARTAGKASERGPRHPMPRGGRARELGGRAARRASHELALTRYELGETWSDITRMSERWHRRRHGVRKGQEALEQYRKLGDHRREALELNALARRYRERGEYADAVVCYTQALTLFERLGNIRGQCLSLSNLGLTHDAQENRQKAVRCYEQSLDLARTMGDRQIEGQVLANLGTSYHRQGRPREGRDLWEQALTLMTPGSSAHRQLSRHLGLEV